MANRSRNECTRLRVVLVWLAVLSIALSAGLSLAGDYRGENPFEPQQNVYQTKLLIVGGSSSGTAAAITAGRLKIPTVWTLRAPRDLGGLSTNAINPDSDLPIRYIGGLALEFDVVARYRSGYEITGAGRGEGYFAPFHVFFEHARKEVEQLPSLTVLANLVPVRLEKEPGTKRVSRVVFAHRLHPEREIVIEPQITIDAEIEGDVAFLAGVEMTLLREGRQASDDPTRDNESYAGHLFTPEKKIGPLIVAGGPLLPGSTQAADTKPATMAYNGSFTLEDYGQGSPDSPWVLLKEPAGYDPAEFDWWKDGIYGVTLGSGQRRWNIDHYLSTVEGWRLPDGRHVLESMDVRDREANEREHLARVVRALWHLQHHTKQYQYGLSHTDFREGLSAKYMLSDFGTRTNEGDMPLPGLIYMREGRRMVNDHVFGGKLIEDDGSGRYVQKRYWHPRAVYYNAMLVDIHGVHKETVPGSGPEGMQLLRLAGFHNFGAPCIPFDVLVPRPEEATGLLVSSAGAYTHQAYAAFPRMETGRIAQGHACAMAAIFALAANQPVHEVDVSKLQIANLQQNGQSLVYFDDTIPGTRWQLIDQMLGVRCVPERNDAGVFQREEYLTVDEAKLYLTRLWRDYSEEPAEPEQLSKALKLLDATVEIQGSRQQAVTRGAVIAAMSELSDLLMPVDTSNSKVVFADLLANDAFTQNLQPWILAGFIQPDAKMKFEPNAPLPFSEFKQHSYHVLFGHLAPETIQAVDYRTHLLQEVFNRPDAALTSLSGGKKISGTGKWKIERGQLRSEVPNTTTYLLSDVGTPDVDLSVDIFLEQSGKPAAAGLVVRAQDDKNMQRFLLDTEGPMVRLRVDSLVDGEHTNAWMERRETLRRGFTLRLIAQGNQLKYYVNDELVYQQTSDKFANGTRVGVLNGGGVPSRFDNLLARPASIPE